jgi:hypothetical protein
MTEPTQKRINLTEIATAIGQEALSDVPRLIFLEERLMAALDHFKTKGDGGLEGAQSCVEACFDYFKERRPDWVEKGLLNPLVETLDTLNALKEGGSSNILSSNYHNINNQPLDRNERFYRGAVSGLIDEVKCRSKCSLDEACRRVAYHLRSRNFPIGRTDSDDSITLKNWRKAASRGQAKGTIDGLQYARSKIMLSKIDAPLDTIIDDALETLRGISPLVIES